jgi:Zn ribbon nucleic-acid-binding protein
MVNDGGVVKRPRRFLSGFLRETVCCPACRGETRVVAFRKRTARFECLACGLRFSVDPAAVGEAMRNHPEAFASDPRRIAAFFVGNPDARPDEDGRAIFLKEIRAAGQVLMFEGVVPGFVKSGGATFGH